MKTRKWTPGKKEWDFIRQNITIMSPKSMAEYFGVPLAILNQEKVEAGIVIEDYVDDNIATAEYALDRWLNRWQRALQWSRGLELLDCCNGFRERIRQEI